MKIDRMREGKLIRKILKEIDGEGVIYVFDINMSPKSFHWVEMCFSFHLY